MVSPGFQRMTAQQIADIACRRVEVIIGDHITAEAALDDVNQGLAELHDLLVASYEDFFISEHSFVAGLTEQVLPADFLKAIRLFDDSDGKPVKRVTLAKLKSEALYPSSWEGLYYRILGTRVHFNKAPPSTVSMFYVPQFTKLGDLGEEVAYQVPVSWYRFVVADMCARLLADEESNFVFYEGRKTQLKEDFKAHAAVRDSEPEPIEDNEPIDFLEC